MKLIWGLVVGACVGFSALFTALAKKFKFGPYLEQEAEQDIQPLPAPSTTPNPPLMPEIEPEVPQPASDGRGRVYAAAKAGLGKHLSLNPSVDPEEGCCQALSVVLKNAGYPIPARGISGVNAMIAWMLAQGFKEAAAPTPGCIITAHNKNAATTTEAHIGVVLNNGIGSNDSRTEYLGLFLENYSGVAKWVAAFPHSQTRYFIPC